MADLLLDSPLVQSIGWALLHFVWQGAAIGLAMALTLLAIDRTHSNARYLVACTGLALMILTPAASVLADRGTVPLEPVALPAVSQEWVRSMSIARALPLAVAVWMAGVLLLSIRLLASCFRVERLKRATREVDDAISRRASVLAHRLGVERAIRVFESALVRVPTVVGHLRPVILLPASVVIGLPAAHLDAVLAHELAHVRRHDYLVNLLQSIVETLLFYHPAVWWCSRQIRIEREHCCDDLVVTVCGDRLAYATALTQLEEMRGRKPMLSLNANGGRLIDRVRRLLAQTPANEGRSTMWAIAGSLTVVVIAIVLTPVFLRADAPRLPATLEQAAPPLVPSQSPGVRVVPDPPPPLEIDGRLAIDHDVAVEALQSGDDPRRALEEALEKLARETGGIPAETPQFGDDPRQAVEEALRKLAEDTGGIPGPAQDPPPAPPLPPRAPRAPESPSPASPTGPPVPPPDAPVVPAPPSPPAPPQAESLPALPKLPAVPAPPAPPIAKRQSLPPAAPALPAPPAPPSEIIQIDPDTLAREMMRASEQLGASFEELLRATKQINEKQAALQQAQAELAKMRAETLAASAKMEAVRNALVELTAKSAALRNGQIDDAEMRKQIESIRQALEDLKAR